MLRLQVWDLRRKLRRRRQRWQRSNRKQWQSPLERMTCLQPARGNRKGSDEKSVQRLLDEVRPKNCCMLCRLALMRDVQFAHLMSSELYTAKSQWTGDCLESSRCLEQDPATAEADTGRMGALRRELAWSEAARIDPGSLLCAARVSCPGGRLVQDILRGAVRPEVHAQPRGHCAASQAIHASHHCQRGESQSQSPAELSCLVAQLPLHSFGDLPCTARHVAGTAGHLLKSLKAAASSGQHVVAPCKVQGQMAGWLLPCLCAPNSCASLQ